MTTPRYAVLLTAFLIPPLRTLMIIGLGLLILLLPSFKGKGLEEVSSWWPLVCIVANLLTIFLLYLLIRRRGLTVRDLVVHGSKKQRSPREFAIVLPLMFVLGIGGLIGFSYLVYGYMPVTNSQPLPVWAAVVSLILLPATIVLAEIPFYLGYSAPLLKQVTGHEKLSILYPLFFYALQHSFFPLLPDWQHILTRFLMFIPLLIMMAIWYSRKKDLLPLMIGHGFLDVGTGIQLLMVSVNPAFFDMLQSAH